MQPTHFSYLTGLIKTRSGIVLGEDKMYLLESRLAPVIKRLGLTDLDALVQHLQRERDDRLLDEITDRMTTNESSFFRDSKPFDALRQKVMPNIMAKTPKAPVRIWSAACSTGQEPYTISICMEEDKAKRLNHPYEIFASDISPSALDRAREGTYSQFEVQRGMPIMFLMKYFAQDKESWVVKEELKKQIRFQQVNLLETFSPYGRFDVIFCRNVLIYFDAETKKKILQKFAWSLNPGGFLFLGAGETVLDLNNSFVPFEGCTGVFQLTNAG
jgi:chemotaxis protein methyltransferase CheR